MHGRQVELTEERWQHIVARHPENARIEHDVLRPVTEAGLRCVVAGFR
jgi:hypothetical protein